MSEFDENKSEQTGHAQGEFAADPRAQREQVNGEYSFVRPDARRSAYSDAGYVPCEDSTMPKSYYCAGEKKSKREKKPRCGLPAAAVIALCLVCAILGGAASGAGVTAYLRHQNQPPAAEESATVINRVSAPTTVTTNMVEAGDKMSATDIYYNLALKQVVGITTEITYTNFWGYTSSSAVSGSGFIISADGYILTNYHVIEEANKGGYEIKVLTYDGDTYTAAIVGYEEDNDVAVLKIDANGFSAATIGDSDGMKVGETVYAVGNPLGELEYTMTDGMVSALDRAISSTDSSTGVTKTINMFQVSAAINSGNSGGPIYNQRGEVIGIATAKYSSTGVESLGFAIPINDAIKIANDLISDGYVRGKAYMGVTVGTVTASAAQYYGLVEGAIVASVEEGSCAERAGLQNSDIIVAIDDKAVTSRDELIKAKKDYNAGDTAVLKVYRGGEYLDLSITFDEATPEKQAAEEAADAVQQPQQQPNNYSGNYNDFFNYFFGSSPFGR